MNLLRTLTPFALALTLSSTTGCGLLAAATNPGAFWAINDPADLRIVVRRADAALITTAEVNRILTNTPAGKDTPWIASVSPDPKAAAAEIKALQQDPDYALTKARVVGAEVWMRSLGDVTATSGEHPSLLAAIDQSLADSYIAIGLKQAEIASFKAQIETEKQAAGADGVSPADKKTHEDQAKALDKQVSDAQAEVDPLKAKFLSQVADACAKVPNEDKARYAPAVGSLLAALDDADVANSAAALKYPIVIKGLPDALKKVVPDIAMDVVEEQIGVRPSLKNLKVGVSISGGSPTITLDGLGDVGSLQPGQVIKLTVTRSVAWFTHTLSLLAVISSTKDRIGWERDILTKMQTAFAPAAPSLVVVKLPKFDSPEVMQAPPGKLGSLASMAHGKAPGVPTGGAVGAAAALPTGIGVGAKAADDAKKKGLPGKDDKKGLPGKDDKKPAAPKAEPKGEKKK